VLRLCEFYPSICLTTEEKARKILSQGKRNPSQVKKNLRVQCTYYQNTHTLQNPHKHTHYKIHKYTHTHTHITEQYKTTIIHYYYNRIPEDARVSIVFCQTVFGGTKENSEYCYDRRSSGLWLKTTRFSTSNFKYYIAIILDSRRFDVN
jgi:hypothetical protein